MRLRTALCLATLFLACFTVAAWSSPAPERLVPGDPQPAPDNQSLSGKIASVDDAAFAIEIAKGKEMNTVQFLVDDQTKVEGKLAVGAQVTVDTVRTETKNCRTSRGDAKLRNEFILTTRSGRFWPDANNSISRLPRAPSPCGLFYSDPKES